MPTQIEPTPEQVAAVHEAGHVVAAWLLGLEVHSITVDHTDGAGRAKITLSSDPLDNARVAVAGSTCQLAFSLPCPHDWAWARDYDAFIEILEEIHPDDESARDTLRWSIEDDVAALFVRSDVRLAVSKLAERVMAARSLEAREIREILMSTLPGKLVAAAGPFHA